MKIPETVACGICPQKTNPCSKSTIETPEEGVKMFKVNNEQRTMMMLMIILMILLSWND